MPSLPDIQYVFTGDHFFRAVLWNAAKLGSPELAPERWLTPQELREYEAIHSSKQRDQRLASRIALKSLLLSEHVVRRATDVSVRKDPNGAPYLVIYEPDTFRYARLPCSISHSGSCVLVAYGLRGTKVGVDIEHRTWRLTYMHRRFLSPKDAMLEKDDSQGDATVLWTFKEALSKVLGMGMAAGFTTLSCRETSIGNCALTDAQGNSYQGCYSWYGRYALSIVFTKPKPVFTRPLHAPAKNKGSWLSRLLRKQRLAARRKAMLQRPGQVILHRDE